MGELDNIAYEAINRYFTVLEKTGYVNNTDVNKLLLLQFLQEFVHEYQGYITEKDYNLINDIIVCLSGSSCLIPFQQYKQLSVPIETFIYSIPVRITEGRTIRHTEKEGLRLVNQ